MTLTVSPVSADEYLQFITHRPVSFVQCPSWASVKDEWAGEHLGWWDESGVLVGVGLVLFRELPLIGRPLAFLTEGPVVDWHLRSAGEWLAPLVEHLRRRKVVALRMGPDLVLHRWRAATVKAAVGSAVRLADVPPDVTEPVGKGVMAALAAAGWVRRADGQGMHGSSRHSFHIALAARQPEDLLIGMNQQWRRGIRKAEKAGVVVEVGGYEDLPDFHHAYLVTAARDGFGAHPLEYFQRLWTALSAEGSDRIRLYLGRHEGEVLAGMLVVTVGGLAGYAYGGSVSHKREVCPSNAVHWRILRDLLAEGADVYDMRGISDTLDPDEPKFGVLRFKLGTGGDVVENIGDWDLPLQRVTYRVVMTALELRSAAFRARAASGAIGSRLRLRPTVRVPVTTRSGR